MRFAIEDEVGFGDGGVDFRNKEKRIAYVSHLAVKGPSPEEIARSYVPVPYAGTEGEDDLPDRVRESNSFLVNLEA